MDCLAFDAVNWKRSNFGRFARMADSHFVTEANSVPGIEHLATEHSVIARSVLVVANLPELPHFAPETGLTAEPTIAQVILQRRESPPHLTDQPAEHRLSGMSSPAGLVTPWLVQPLLASLVASRRALMRPLH